MSFKKIFLLFMVMGFVFSVDISACGVLAPNAEYDLTADLSGVDGANNYCIRVSENTTLDCQGHSITSTAPTDVYGIDNAGNLNITIKNCEINGYDYGIYLFISKSAIANNSIDGAADTNLYLVGDNNSVSYNLLTSAGRYNMYSNGDYSNFTNNTAAASEDSCFHTGGDHNTLINNSAYFCDLVALDGGAFEIGDNYNVLRFNHAENSSNGYYIEGQGMLLINNTAYGNMIGINVLPDGWEGHILIDNVAEENLAFDFMVGGDIWLASIFAFTEIDSYVCNNTVVNLTGSGGREVRYAWGTGIPSLDDSLFSQAIICGSPGLTIDNMTLDGSDTLDNNGFIAINSNLTHISNSNSHDNLAGFWFLNSDDPYLSSVNTSGNFAGVIGVFSNNTQFSSVRSYDNKVNASLLLSYLSGGGAIINETIYLGFGALFFGSNNTGIKSSHFYNNTAGVVLIGDISGGDLATGLDVYSGSSMHDNDYAGLMVLGTRDISITDLDAYNHDTPFMNITQNISFGPISMNLSSLAGVPLGFGAVFLSVDNVSISNSEFYNNYWAGSVFMTGINLAIDSTEMHGNNISGLAILGGENISIDGLEAYGNEGTFPNIPQNISLGPISINLSSLAGTPMGFGAMITDGINFSVSNCNFSDNYDGATLVASGSVPSMGTVNSSHFDDNARNGLTIDDDSYISVESSQANSNGEAGIYFSTGMLMILDTNLSSNMIGLHFADAIMPMSVPYAGAMLNVTNASFVSNGDDFAIDKSNTSIGAQNNTVVLIGWFGDTEAEFNLHFTNDTPQDLFVNTVLFPPPYTLAGYDPLGLNIDIGSNTAFNLNLSGIFYNATDIAGRNESNLQLLEYTGATWVIVPNQTNMTTPFGNAIMMENQSTFSVFGLFENSTNYTPPTPPAGGKGSGKDTLEMETDSPGHTLDEVIFTVTVDGKKAKEVKIYVTLEGGTVAILLTDSQGLASFIPMEAGLYSAEAKSGEYKNSDVKSFDILWRQFEIGIPSSINEDEEFSILVNYNGEPVEGASVSIDGNERTTGQDGKATFSLSQGTYEVTVSREGYEQWEGTLHVGEGEMPEEEPELPIPIIPVEPEPVEEPEVPVPSIIQTDVPSVESPIQPVDEAQVEVQQHFLWLILLLLIVVALVWYCLSTRKKGKK